MIADGGYAGENFTNSTKEDLLKLLDREIVSYEIADLYSMLKNNSMQSEISKSSAALPEAPKELQK